MKINTEEEALAKGFDPAVCRISGDYNHVSVNPLSLHHEIKLNFPISVDTLIHSFDARTEVPPLVSSFRFESGPPHERKVKVKFLDALSIDRHTLDCFILGMDTLVSESARDKLAPFLKEECSFIPVDLVGAPQPYFVMWIHKICDAIDEERSLLGNDDWNPLKKRPFRAAFHLNKIDAHYLFRVPQWKYSMDCDLALKPFRDLVEKLKIRLYA